MTEETLEEGMLDSIDPIGNAPETPQSATNLAIVFVTS